MRPSGDWKWALAHMMKLRDLTDDLSRDELRLLSVQHEDLGMLESSEAWIRRNENAEGVGLFIPHPVWWW